MSTTNHSVITEDVLRKINEAYVTDNYRTCASFGYRLAIKELEGKDKEIERLKGLIESTYKNHIKLTRTDLMADVDQLWNHFKKLHNL